MEPADNLFSSPEKENGGKAAANGHEESESDNEQDMEIDEGMRADRRGITSIEAWC